MFRKVSNGNRKDSRKTKQAILKDNKKFKLKNLLVEAVERT